MGCVGCVYDYIEIFDGNRSDATNLGRFCGSNKPAPIRSSTNELFLKFVSDSSITRSGFVASYTAEYNGKYVFFPLKNVPLFKKTILLKIPCYKVDKVAHEPHLSRKAPFIFNQKLSLCVTYQSSTKQRTGKTPVKKSTSVDEKEKVEVKLHAALVLDITYWAIYEPRRDT